MKATHEKESPARKHMKKRAITVPRLKKPIFPLGTNQRPISVQMKMQLPMTYNCFLPYLLAMKAQKGIAAFLKLVRVNVGFKNRNKYSGSSEHAKKEEREPLLEKQNIFAIKQQVVLHELNSNLGEKVNQHGTNECTVGE